MSIDDRARSAAGELRAATAGGVRMATMTEIEKTSTHRRRTRTVAAATTALIVAIGVGAVALTQSNPTARPADPVSTVSPSPTGSADTRLAVCSFEHITCLGGRTIRAEIAVPVTVTLPTTITGDDAQTTGTELEAYVDSHSNMGLSGVTVLESAVATKADSPSTADRSSGTTAASAAAWLASRPFVLPTKPVMTTVGGFPAYRVHVVLKPGARLVGPAKGDGAPTAATFASGVSWSAASESMNDSTYYLLDLPHAGLTVVWSWTFGSSPEDAAAREAYVQALHFG